MNDVETELRRAFQRRQPSAGFAERVIEAMRQGRARKRERQRWMAMAAAVVVLCGLGGGYWQMRRAARRTVDQLNLAVQITGEKLNFVREAAARGLLEKNLAEKNFAEKSYAGKNVSENNVGEKE
jgi:hypothetical protein